MKYIVFMCCTIKMLISNWPRPRKFSHLSQAGKTVAVDFAHHGHALLTIFMLWLVKIWQVSSCGRFMQHLESCLLQDSWSWQSFVSTYDVFNCLFSLDAQNEIQLAIAGVFFYSWLVGFWLRNTSLIKIGIRFRMASFLFFTSCLMCKGWKVRSDTGLTWYLLGAASRMVSLSNYCIWCLFFLYLSRA